jgi:tetratricopeptide (TPR) repeat protein
VLKNIKLLSTHMFTKAFTRYRSTPAKTTQDTENKIHTYTTLVNFYVENGYNKDAVAALRELAQLYYDHDKPGEAAKSLRMISTIDPSASSSLYQLKSSLVGQEKNQGAPKELGNSALNSPHEAIFKEIMSSGDNSTDKNSPDFHYKLGLAHKELNQLDEAVEEFKLALAKLKAYELKKMATGVTRRDCYHYLVRCYCVLSKPSLSAEYARKALSLYSLTEEDKVFFLRFIPPQEYSARQNKDIPLAIKLLLSIKNTYSRLQTIIADRNNKGKLVVISLRR